MQVRQPHSFMPLCRKTLLSFSKNAVSQFKPINSFSLSHRRLISTTSLTPNEQEENLKKAQRPLSPHLTIWKPELPMIMSSLHRISGVALTGMFYSWAMVYGVFGVPSVTSLAGCVADLSNSLTTFTLVVLPVKFALSSTLFFHSLNGIRHLVWDNVKALSLDGVWKSGWIVTGLTVALASYYSLFV